MNLKVTTKLCRVLESLNEPFFYDGLKTSIADFMIITTHTHVIFVGVVNSYLLEIIKKYNCIQDDSNTIIKQAKEMILSTASGTATKEQVPLLIFGTPFEKSILSSVKLIPRGEVRTYAEIALNSGYKNAVRACGSAIAKNLLLILIPCHRVVPSSYSPAKPGNYSGGVRLKQKLLSLENVLRGHRKTSVF